MNVCIHIDVCKDGHMCDGYDEDCANYTAIVHCKDCKYAEDLIKLHGFWFCNRNCCAKFPTSTDGSGFCAWGKI